MYPYNLPGRTRDGKFYVLIITSGRELRWPYRAKDDTPRYKTREEAEKILKAYVKFANKQGKNRIEAEFEVMEL